MPKISSKSQVMQPTILFSILSLITSLIIVSEARIHHLNLEDDSRQHFKISSFGYLLGGSLRVNLSQFSFRPPQDTSKFGFSLLKTRNDALHPYSRQRDFCILESDDAMKWFDENIGLVTITFDIQNKEVIFKCNPLMKMLEVKEGYRNYSPHRVKRNSTNQVPNSNDKLGNIVVAKAVEAVNNPNASYHQNLANNSNNAQEKPTIKSAETKAPIETKSRESTTSVSEESEEKGDEFMKDKGENDDYCHTRFKLIPRKDKDNQNIYSFSFHTSILDDSLVGLYSLYFHNCPNYKHNILGSYQLTHINLSMTMEEKNFESYLSAGEIPLPQLHFTLSFVFFILALIWLQTLRNRKDSAFKIHYLMGALVFIKALALFFHSINYHYISEEGSQIETWAVLYYVTHFLKGALLFITIALIGTGWAFIKHILSDKDKKMFMIVIPLQVLANVAEIITEESEEGQLMHNVWRSVFILVDLICCGAILFPIIWSIRHLQEASHIDGKAAINLIKLKLFRRFYVIIVCYIYFTRIIVYILEVMVPFQYEWLDIFFQNAATLLFFIFTGYHFQPTHNNPYFRLSQKDLEMEEILFNVTPNIYVASSTKKRTRDKTGDENKDDRQALISDKEDNLDFE